MAACVGGQVTQEPHRHQAWWRCPVRWGGGSLLCTSYPPFVPASPGLQLKCHIPVASLPAASLMDLRDAEKVSWLSQVAPWGVFPTTASHFTPN